MYRKVFYKEKIDAHQKTAISAKLYLIRPSLRQSVDLSDYISRNSFSQRDMIYLVLRTIFPETDFGTFLYPSIAKFRCGWIYTTIDCSICHGFLGPVTW